MSLIASTRREEEARFADVILPLSLSKSLTYGIPVDLQRAIVAGMRVEVSLGKNKLYSAIVKRLHNEQPEGYQVKPIRSIIDEQPIITDKQLQFWDWIAEYYMATPGEVMQAALPAHLKLMNETRIMWSPQHEDVVYEWSDEAFVVVEELEQKNELTISELRSMVGARHFTKVLGELLEQEVIVVRDELEEVYKTKKERIVTLAKTYRAEEKLHELFDTLSRAPKQLELLMAYVELSVKFGAVRQIELLDRSGASAQQIKALADKGIFIISEVAVDRLGVNKQQEAQEVIFTEAQQEAFEYIEKEFEEKNVVLLEGVTGSGKTLLYINKIKECIAQGKQAILLLPEIGLTTQLMTRLYAYFGEELGVYHSRFSNNERVEIWEKVRRGDYKVVVGPRSALWLPYEELGLIIVDEEHDISYKQKDPAPRFHARDAAIYLAALHNAKVLLGTATPSIESMYNAKAGKYGYVTLQERYLGVNMPVIEMIDTKSLAAYKKQGINLITPELFEAISKTLDAGKQVILFQNRRGYAPFQLCTVCGWVPQCKNCAVSLTYHKSTDKLHCHYCGLRYALVHNCPSCGSNRLQSKTFGTEKIEEEVRQLFPKAKTARMDVDTMRGKDNYSRLMQEMAKQKVDVLIGTQMVVKGLDFSNVSLVGILSADSLLSYPDFRVNERAFQLMEQVSGRAGRTDGVGVVLIQAHNIAHPVLAWVKAHNVAAFYNHEIQYRQHFHYPPFVRLIKVTFKHRDEVKAIVAAADMAKELNLLDTIMVQGPVAALVPRVRNQYIQEVWIKCPRDAKVIKETKAFVVAERNRITSQRGNSLVHILFDVDPLS
ncbi:MAG: primosomal protein N' [Flavipsychrobacter sp.]